MYLPGVCKRETWSLGEKNIIARNLIKKIMPP